MKKFMLTSIVGLTIFILSGCLYPAERMSQNQVPYKDQVASVQAAVDQFKQESGGLLPIKTKDMDTPIYQKYPIDFTKIVPRYMQDAPGNSYESGGIFAYVLVDAETKPTVKLLDLRMADTIQDVNVHLNIYRQNHKGYVPFKDVIAPGVFSINYKKLNMKEPPVVTSPYTGNSLSLIVNGQGDVFVDYRPDLYDAIQKHKSFYKPGEDIRKLLVENSDFVPAYSLPYTVNDKNEPIFFKK
ncbi:hypothetical protein CN367_27760 [Priestia megaterium]|uniref:hypothetical protein n=1 Tax=Priestia megaterium TaxID=1404 RepID=UPI000BFA2D07|nr:hypothetical protein [Priestia megaterium]MED4614676.1 hypothetical protein [Priestia megaterium]PEZ43785.1 hypothetical protein CN367_27760 [Priestia megaterium]QCR29285.1 hypothetical protein C1N54_21325 [Priestia megaterium]